MPCCFVCCLVPVAPLAVQQCRVAEDKSREAEVPSPWSSAPGKCHALNDTTRPYGANQGYKGWKAAGGLAVSSC